MADLGWIEIRNWDRFQTYDTKRSERPPWIKVYTRLMSDDAFLELTGDQRAILLGLWLEFASSTPRLRADDVSTTCRLRADTRSLTRRLNLRVTARQLKRLEDAGFINLVALTTSAEEAREERASYAREEVETETEVLSQDRSSRSEITSETRPDLTESEDPHKDEEEQPFAREPEPELNGAGYDLPTIEQRPNLEPDDSMERLSVPADVEELVERWSGETA